MYTVRVVGDGGAYVGHGSTQCITSPCLYVQQVYISATSYTIFVASVNGDGNEGPYNTITINSKSYYDIISAISKWSTNQYLVHGCVASTQFS